MKGVPTCGQQEQTLVDPTLGNISHWQHFLLLSAHGFAQSP